MNNKFDCCSFSPDLEVLQYCTSIQYLYESTNLKMCVCICSHHLFKQSLDQTGKFGNPARGQLNRENECFPVPVRTRRENLVPQERFGRPVPRQPAHSPHSGCIWILLKRFLPLSAAISIYLFIPSTAIGSVPRLPCHAIAYRWRFLPRVRWHKASPQCNSSNGCCLFRYITMD